MAKKGEVEQLFNEGIEIKSAEPGMHSLRVAVDDEGSAHLVEGYVENGNWQYDDNTDSSFTQKIASRHGLGGLFKR